MREELKQIIDTIESIVGYCYYDELDDDEVGTVELISDEFYGVVFEVDIENFRVSTSRTFTYDDFEPDNNSENEFIKDAIETNRWTRLHESNFELFLKRNSPYRVVSVWDDGCFMCPGYVSRVGFYNESFSEQVIKEFVSLCEDYDSRYINLSEAQLRKNIFESICHQNNISSDCFFESNNNGISVFFSESSLSLSHESNVENYYFGKEILLFSALGNTYCSRLAPVKIFSEVHQKCELEQQDLILFLEELPLLNTQDLVLTSPHMVMRIPAKMDTKKTFARSEEMNIIVRNGDFLSFSSESFQKGYSKMFSNLMRVPSGDTPLIITEGPTDCKHLKKYYDLYRPNVSISFLEFESSNTSSELGNKIEMGSSSLLNMCKAYCMTKQERIYIFIADRDEPKIIKEMSEQGKNYRNWGNNVFSFVLPVPNHRTETPHICIEHLYSDEELKTYHLCKDGVKRRLFLGNDFDEYGRNTNENLLCIKRNICGKNSIKVIDGSTDTRVICFTDPKSVNYALSKQDFATLSKIENESETYQAFTKVFEIIEEIITDNS